MTKKLAGMRVGLGWTAALSGSLVAPAAYAETLAAVTEYSYDAVGRPLCTAIRMNPAAWSALSDACTREADGANGPDRITKNNYDAAGQLIQLRKAVGTGLEQAYATYSYTADGKQEYVIDANGNRAKMEYDGFNRLNKWIFPAQTRPATYAPADQAGALAQAGSVNTADYEAYGYDANGNRTSFRKRDGSTLTYTYDALNRVATKVVPERSGLATTHTRDVYFGYDNRGLQTYARFDSASGDGIVNVYDGLGRLTSATATMDGQSRQLAFAYDVSGNRTSTTWPDNASVTMTYDGLNRALLIKDVNGAVLSSRAYNDQGLLSTSTRSSAASAQGFTYDAVGRLATESITGGAVASQSVWTYLRNPASQITSEARSNDTYSWNGYYNVSRAYTTNGLNQYTAAGVAAFCYDANGNLTADGGSVYLYDVENRLVEKRTQTNTACSALSYAGTLQASLRYDPMGRLYEATGTSTTRFLYDGDALVGEYNASGALLRRYAHGNDVGADDPMIWFEGSSALAANARHLYTDPRGSIVLTGDASGNPIAINTYDEYGIPGSANQGRFQYTGQAWLAEIGMYYYKARIYSPTLGRFLQTDPIGYKDQINLYAYVANDPVNHADPTGNDTVVQLQYYIIGNAPIQGDFGHQYVIMRDTDTGATVISRAGPSSPYSGGSLSAASDSPSRNPSGPGNVTIQTSMTPAAKSIDAGQNSKVVPGSTTTLKEPIGKAEATLGKFNQAVDSAKIDYTPRSNNSNAYAGTAYQALTGKTAPSMGVLPGSNNNLKPQIPACTSDPKVCGGR